MRDIKDALDSVDVVYDDTKVKALRAYRNDLMHGEDVCSKIVANNDFDLYIRYLHSRLAEFVVFSVDDGIRFRTPVSGTLFVNGVGSPVRVKVGSILDDVAISLSGLPIAHRTDQFDADFGAGVTADVKHVMVTRRNSRHTFNHQLTLRVSIGPTAQVGRRVVVVRALPGELPVAAFVFQVMA